MTVLYGVMILISLYGCYNLKTDFRTTFLISEDSQINNYFTLKEEYFNTGFTATFYIVNPDLDFKSLEVQRQILEFEDAIERSRQCDEGWFITNTYTSWYKNFHQWVSQGHCYVLRSGISPFEKGVDPEKFYECLWEFKDNNPEKYNERDILFNDEIRREYKEIEGYKFTV